MVSEYEIMILDKDIALNLFQPPVLHLQRCEFVKLTHVAMKEDIRMVMIRISWIGLPDVTELQHVPS